jgi:CheY-like chemotaxis protein
VYRKGIQARQRRNLQQTKSGVRMNTPLFAIPLSAPIPDVVKKKRVLLIDTSHTTRDLRSEVLRRRGIDVDSAADIAEARAWWRPALYDLVLIHMEKGRGQRDKFCDDLRSATPAQRLAFLVGQPEYLVDLPNADQELAMEGGDGQSTVMSSTVVDDEDALPADAGDKTQRWGIMEASRRISAVRSACVARTQAMDALPPPPRDFEGKPEKTAATLASLDDLLKEELP